MIKHPKWLKLIIALGIIPSTIGFFVVRAVSYLYPCADIVLTYIIGGFVGFLYGWFGATTIQKYIYS